MPSWGILKSSKKKARSAHKVHFQLADNQDQAGLDNRSRSSSDASDQHVQGLGHHSPKLGSRGQLDISHTDIEDEEERQCLKHLDKLGLTLENTFKDVESIDAYVRKLQHDFNHEIIPEKRFMSCICSAKIARAACCKKQIEVWQKLQHDIQESCCHHHYHHHHHHHQHGSQQEPHGRGSNDSLTEPPDHLASDSDTSSISTISSQDSSSEAEVIVSHLQKMVFFDIIRQRLDPSANFRTFVNHWILNGLHAYNGNTVPSGHSRTHDVQS